MENKFSSSEILDAVKTILEKKIKKKTVKQNFDKKEIKIPIDTENIISQAEKTIREKN